MKKIEMSPRAVATLAFHLINDFPDVLKTASIPKMEFRVEGDQKWKTGTGCCQA